MLLGAIDLLNTCRLKLPAENVVTQISLRTDGIRVSNASLDVSFIWNEIKSFLPGAKLPGSVTKPNTDDHAAGQTETRLQAQQ